MAEYTWDQVYMKNRGKDADGISDEDTTNFYYMSDSALKEFKASVYPFCPQSGLNRSALMTRLWAFLSQKALTYRPN